MGKKNVTTTDSQAPEVKANVTPELIEALKLHPYVETIYLNGKGQWHFTETAGFEPFNSADILAASETE